MKSTSAAVVSILVVAVAMAPRPGRADPAQRAFAGAAYENPGNWQEQAQGDTRVLVAPRPRPGELLLVFLSKQFKVIKDPASDLDALARQTEKAATSSTHGPQTSTQAHGFTVTTMAAQVEDPALGKHQRIYELVSDQTAEVFVAVIAKGDRTFADHRDELMKILLSCHPTSTTSSEAAAPPADGAIPYADTPGKFPGDPLFRPSGKGKAIPTAAIVNGAPQGLWWTYTTSGTPTAYGTIFFPDGMALHYYRPGGPNLADLDGMKANRGADDIGEWSLGNGRIAIHFATLRTSVPYTAGRDRDGPFFKAGTDVYRPATPLTAKAVVGTWEIRGTGEFTFSANGTVQTTTAMIGSIAGLGAKRSTLNGTWLVDGYLLVMNFPGEGARVYPVFQVSATQIVISSWFYLRK
jgi:hypothetical protein